MSVRRRSLRELVLSRLPRRDDDRGSMMLAFLVIVIAAGIGAMMLPSLINQDHSTRFDTSRVRSLHAAQTGIDVVLGQFRATKLTDSNGKVWGDDGGLPCYPAASPLVAYADGANASQYSVSLQYFLPGPDPSSGSATAMSVCASGYGPFDPASGSRTPGFARITSTGTDLAGGQQTSRGRTIITTYVFQTDDTNISGGVVHLFPDGSGNQWCWDAGSAIPSIGTALVLRACSTTNPATPQQVFAYRTDLSFQLVSSVTAANPKGLCIDTATTPHSANVALVLKQCAIADPTKCITITNCSPWNQQWSVDDNAHLEGALNNQSNIDGYCINASAQTDGQPIVLATCAGTVTDTKQTWVPAPTAGAGMAGPNNNQLVNFKQFATCLDVTGQDPNAAFLIIYTCKQNPDPTQVAWNQKFTPSPAVGVGPTRVLLKTTKNGTTYCLTSPLTTTGYVRVTTPCPANVNVAPARFVWTVSQSQDGSGNDLAYQDKYTIKDGYTGPQPQHCLAPGPNSDLLNGQYYKIYTLPCDGTTAQKWNANPSLDASKLQNTHETEG
ncbi:MAG: hypothetical protein ACRDVG_08865 [Jatrophihabitantaceae bacterium]